MLRKFNLFLLLISFFFIKIDLAYAASPFNYIASIYCSTIGAWFESSSCKEKTPDFIINPPENLQKDNTQSIKENTLDKPLTTGNVYNTYPIREVVVFNTPQASTNSDVTSYFGNSSITIPSINVDYVTSEALNRQIQSVFDSVGKSLANLSTPTTASTTDWNNFFIDPSTRITAGTGLSWSGNTLSATGGSGSVSGGFAGMLTSWISSTELTSTSTPTASAYTATSTTATSTFAGGLSVEGQLGPELVTNGSFTSDLTGWSGTNWSYSAGTALHSTGSVADLTQSTVIPTVGDTYKVTFTVTSGSGYRARMYFGGTWSDFTKFDGTYTVYVTATIADSLLFRPSNTLFNGTVDNVSVRKVITNNNVNIEAKTDFVKSVTIHDKIIFPDGHAIAIGSGAFDSNGTGTYNLPSTNICIGYNCGKVTTIGQVTAVGYQAALTFTGEGSVTAFGKNAGASLGAESYVTMVGNYAGAQTTTGRSSCYGDESCGRNTTGEKTAFGGYGCYANITGDCDAFGLDALRYYGSLSTENAAFGRNSLTFATSSYNSAFGNRSGYNVTTGLITALGNRVAYNTTTGTTTALGKWAGYSNVDGGLICIGNFSCYGGTTTNAPVSDTKGILIGEYSNRSVVSATSLSNYIGIGDGVLISKSNQVVLGNTDIVETILRGNIGIGTTTPYASLSITNTAAIPSFVVEDSTSPDSSPFIITDTGKVGIGNSNPGTDLVVGNTGTTGTILSGTGSSFTPQITSIQSTGMAGISAQVMDGTNNRRVGLFVDQTNAIQGISSLYSSGAIPFVYRDASAERLRIDTSGKLGLGTTSPLARLDIAGSNGGTDILLQLSSVTGFATTTRFSVTNAGTASTTALVVSNGSLFGDGSAAAPGISFSSDTDTGFQKEANDRLAFVAGGAVRTYFDQTSIQAPSGTTASPGYKFASNGAYGFGYSTTGTTRAFISGNAVEALSVTSAASVGIGSTSPSSKFAVTQSSNDGLGGIWLSETGNTDFRSMYMNTSGVLSFYGGDTAGTLNTATLNAAGAWTSASDISYKENIIPLNTKYNLDTLMALKPVHYEMKGNHIPQIGFIAQEMEKEIPEVVSGEEGKKGISYGNITALTVSSLQDISKILGISKNASSTLFVSTKLESIESRLNTLELSKGITTNITEWIGEKISSVTGIFTKVKTQELCIEEVCINKDQLRTLLDKNGVIISNQIQNTNINSNSNTSSDSKIDNSSSTTNNSSIENTNTTTNSKNEVSNINTNTETINNTATEASKTNLSTNSESINNNTTEVINTNSNTNTETTTNTSPEVSSTNTAPSSSESTTVENP